MGGGIACPSCQRLDRVRKASAIYRSGTTDTETHGSGGSVFIGRRGVRGYRPSYYSSRSRRQTLLAAHLAPPRLPDVGLKIGLGIGLMILGGIIVMGAFSDALSSQGNSLGGVSCLLLLGIPSLLGGKKIHDAAVTEKTSCQQIYQQYYSLWDNTYYCSRCDGVFLPGQLLTTVEQLWPWR